MIFVLVFLFGWDIRFIRKKVSIMVIFGSFSLWLDRYIVFRFWGRVLDGNVVSIVVNWNNLFFGLEIRERIKWV